MIKESEVKKATENVERAIYAEKVETITRFNPFVDMPRMRMSAVSRLNELIARDEAMPIAEQYYEITDHTSYICPVCKGYVDTDRDNFCRICGQRLDRENIAL